MCVACDQGMRRSQHAGPGQLGAVQCPHRGSPWFAPYHAAQVELREGPPVQHTRRQASVHVQHVHTDPEAGQCTRTNTQTRPSLTHGYVAQVVRDAGVPGHDARQHKVQRIGGAVAWGEGHLDSARGWGGCLGGWQGGGCARGGCTPLHARPLAGPFVQAGAGSGQAG